MKTANQLRKELDEEFKKRGLPPLNWVDKTGSFIYTKGRVNTNSLKTVATSSKRSKWEEWQERVKTHNWLLVSMKDCKGGTITVMEETFKLMQKLGYKASADLLSNVPWFYVNLNDKLFFSGRIGIDMLSGKECIGKHAISFKEFLMIDDIYNKYEGLNVLEFNEL